MSERKIREFPYEDLSELRRDIEDSGLEIPLSEDVRPLTEGYQIKGRELCNSFCTSPMEGFDGKNDGSPGELTFRKYRRLAAGGTGIIWIEATAITESGKSNPRQLFLNQDSKENFKRLVKSIRENELCRKDGDYYQLLILQLSHHGRSSKPEGNLASVITHHSEILDSICGIPEDYPVIKDKELDNLKEKYLKVSQLAYDCGFDGVDIKACHGSLIHELLSSRDREGSKYGGSFTNRTRFLRDTVRRVKKELPELICTSRLSFYDGVPFPSGWGVKEDGSLKPDLTEPMKLIDKLQDLGLDMINVGLSNPVYDSFIMRPHDVPLIGKELPDRKPLETLGRNIDLTCEIAEEFPDVHFVGTEGLSWLREFFPNVGSAMKMRGLLSSICVGRNSLANPSFPNELINYGKLDREKLCTTCSSCNQMIRDGVEVGCPIRDTSIYGPIYREGRRGS